MTAFATLSPRFTGSRPRRALVTGAGGFVGANLARRLLADGHQVRCLVRPGSDRWRLDGLDADVHVDEVDLRDESRCRAAVLEAKPEWVFHLAAHGAYSWQTDVRQIFATNLGSSVTLGESCLEAGCEVLVHTGSSSEYGYKDHPPSEDDPLEPNSPYAAAKAAATLYFGLLGRESSMRTITLRLYSAYGPWEEPDRLLPMLVARGLRGELPPLVNPDVARDFVYVDDVVEALVLVAERKAPRAGAVYNVGTGTQVTIRQAVEIARRVLGIEAEPEFGSMVDRGWDTSTWVADRRRIERELGWRPSSDLAQGLASLVAWLRSGEAPVTRYGLDRGS